MRRFKFPLFAMLLVAVLVGIAWGLKIQKNTSRRKAPEADATTLKVLALTHSLPPAVVKVFEAQANIKVQLTEEPTTEALWSRLEKDSSFDLITLLNHQTAAAAASLKIQPIKLSDIPGTSTLSSDFLDLPGETSPTVIPLLWGLNGYATDVEAANEFSSWEQLTTSKLEGGFALKPSVLNSATIAEAVLGPNATDAAFRERVRTLSERSGKLPTFLTMSSEFDSELGAFEASHGESLFEPIKGGTWTYRLPTDGALLWILSISMGGKTVNPAGAKKFMEFLLKPVTAVALSQQSHQASCNKAVETSAKLEAALKPSHLRTIPLERIRFTKAKTVERL